MKQLSIFRAHSKWIEISWPQEISSETLRHQLAVRAFLEKEYIEGIKEIRIGFNTLSLKLNIPISEDQAEELLQEIKELPKGYEAPTAKVWEIPVCYDRRYGRDIGKLALMRNISEEEVMRLHSEKDYLLHFYGFLPGFMYLGGLDERLSTPRKKNPEKMVVAGTVAIGGQQTGIYPMDSPGGWHAIGRTPWKVFDINRAHEMNPKIGDVVRFRPISLEEFDEYKNGSTARK